MSTCTTKRGEYVYTDEGLMAVRLDGGEWIDAYGGTFSARDIRDLTAFAAGEIDAVAFGVPSLRMVRK